MATLSADVQARYSTQILKNLTNPQSAGSSAIDTTRLDNACTDTQAEFEVYAHAEYDADEPRHVSVAVAHVVAILKRYTGQKGADEEYRRSLDRMKALAKVENRARITPDTNSPLQSTSEQTSANVTPRPATDWPVFEDIVPDPPGGGGDTET